MLIVEEINRARCWKDPLRSLLIGRSIASVIDQWVNCAHELCDSDISMQYMPSRGIPQV